MYYLARFEKGYNLWSTDLRTRETKIAISLDANYGSPYLVIGTPGGRTIINTTFQAILNVLEFKMPIDKAIESMKIHHQWLPDVIYYEPDKLSPDTRNALEAMGHSLSDRRTYLGRLMGIIYDPDLDVFIGASDSGSPDSGVSGY